MHSELLSKTENKYSLVLMVARRAKIIKDEIQRDGTVEVLKPIPLAIQQMVDEAHEDAAAAEAAQA